LLMTFTRNGVGELTTFHRHVIEAARDLEARLVVIETAADAFGGNENDRNQVRQFVQRGLGQIALKIDGALVCCAHPSRAGLSSGEGDSGSTGWNNAFRSRLYLHHPENGPKEPPDPTAPRRRARTRGGLYGQAARHRRQSRRKIEIGWSGRVGDRPPPQNWPRFSLSAVGGLKP
jgi:AAA domain